MTDKPQIVPGSITQLTSHSPTVANCPFHGQSTTAIPTPRVAARALPPITLDGLLAETRLETLEDRATAQAAQSALSSLHTARHHGERLGARKPVLDVLEQVAAELERRLVEAMRKEGTAP